MRLRSWHARMPLSGLFSQRAYVAVVALRQRAVALGGIPRTVAETTYRALHAVYGMGVVHHECDRARPKRRLEAVSGTDRSAELSFSWAMRMVDLTQGR